MTEHDEFKQRLLNASWRIYKTFEVDGMGGPVRLDIRMPPFGVLKPVLDKAKALKESSSEADGDALEFAMEVVALTVWRPGGLRPLFTVEEVKTWPHALAVMRDCMEALNIAGGLETAKGNSEATPA